MATGHEQIHTPAKEGVVIDVEGNTIYSPARERAQQRRATFSGPGFEQVRVYRGAWWLPMALGVGIPVLLVAGIFVFAVLMTLGLLILFVRSILGLGKPLGSKQ